MPGGIIESSSPEDIETESSQTPNYLNVGLDNVYELFPGVFALPIAALPPTDAESQATFSPVVIVTAHAPYRVRTVNYAAKKQITPPLIPTPADNGVYTFLSGSVVVPAPQINTAGAYDWTAGSQYQFIENAYSDINSGYIIGGPPFVTVVQMANAQSTSQVAAGTAPQSVQQAGLDVQVGYNIAQNLDNSGDGIYQEASYFPANFQSDSIICGPTSANFPTLPPQF